MPVGELSEGGASVPVGELSKGGASVPVGELSERGASVPVGELSGLGASVADGEASDSEQSSCSWVGAETAVRCDSVSECEALDDAGCCWKKLCRVPVFDSCLSCFRRGRPDLFFLGPLALILRVSRQNCEWPLCDPKQAEQPGVGFSLTRLLTGRSTVPVDPGMDSVPLAFSNVGSMYVSSRSKDCAFL